MNSFENFGSFKLSADELAATAVPPTPWNNVFRYITDAKRFPGYKRGILRQTQLYDPYVNAALKSFSPELHDSIKGYTRAPGDEWDVYERLTRYDASPLAPIDNPRFKACYDAALSDVMKEFKLRDPVVPHWILDVDLVKNTSSGFPHFTRKGDILDQIRQEGRSHFHLLKRLPLWRVPLLPCTPATRGGLADITEPKTRLVWMYPAAMTAIEAVFAQPLISGLFSEKSEYLITGVDTKHRIQRYLSLLSEDAGRLGVGLDFKSFDTLRCNWLIRDAFDVLKQNVYFSGYYDDTNGLQTFGPGKTERLEHAWSNIVEYFIHTPILLPNGRCVNKHTGVPSGSHFTNLIDSIICRILIKTFSLYCSIPISNLRTNGDDSAFHVYEDYASDIILRAAGFFKEFFGMTINTDKSCVAGSPSEMHVSGTRWTGLRPTRSTQEWMMLAAYGETYSRIPFDSFQRLLGLGLSGGFGDSTFTRFFDYFQTGYDCRHGPNLLNWKKLRFLQQIFSIEELPLVYKQGAKTTLRLRLLVT